MTNDSALTEAVQDIAKTIRQIAASMGVVDYVRLSDEIRALGPGTVFGVEHGVIVPAPSHIVAPSAAVALDGIYESVRISGSEWTTRSFSRSDDGTQREPQADDVRSLLTSVDEPDTVFAYIRVDGNGYAFCSLANASETDGDDRRALRVP